MKEGPNGWPISIPAARGQGPTCDLTSPPALYLPLAVTLPDLALPLCQESHRPQKAPLPRVSPSAQVQSTWTLGGGCRGAHWLLQKNL